MGEKDKDGKKWKSYFIIFSEVQIANETYFINDFILKIESIPEIIQTDRNPRFKLLVNTFAYDSSQSIENAYLKAISGTKLFLNRISLIGYCETQILNHLITTVDRCGVGEKFEVLSSTIHHSRSFKHEITSADFLKLSAIKEPYIEITLSLLKKALSTQSIEEKIMMLTSCLERLGLEESQEYITTKCEQCGHQVSTNNKSTKKYSKNLLKQKGATSTAITNFLERDRNKIAHGGGERDVVFYSELKESILKIQHLIVEIMAERCGADLVNSSTSIIDLPTVVYQYEKQANGYKESQGSIRFSSTAGISKVSKASTKAQSNLTFEIGVSFNESNPIIYADFQRVFFPKGS